MGHCVQRIIIQNQKRLTYNDNKLCTFLKKYKQKMLDHDCARIHLTNNYCTFLHRYIQIIYMYTMLLMKSVHVVDKESCCPSLCNCSCDNAVVNNTSV